MQTLKIFTITPMAKPRMVQSDKWKKRSVVMRYWDFKAELLRQRDGFIMPESGYHATFIIPMPKSWSKKKRLAMNGQPHKTKPDKDNLEKALLDALETDDAHIWDGRVTKVWGKAGIIIIRW